MRGRFHGTLAKARIPMQIDIGFGDVIVPRPVDVEYPAMLEFPAQRWKQTPFGLAEAFTSDPVRAAQWRAFVRRSRLDSEWQSEQIVQQVRLFAAGPLAAVAENRPFVLQWRPGGPWD